VRRRHEFRALHLNVDQHRIERRVEPKSSDKIQQFAVFLRGLVLEGVTKEVVEGAARGIEVPLDGRG
jgi:hypothetical protein